jgi:hypothetical protein
LSLTVIFYDSAQYMMTGLMDCRYSDYVTAPCADTIRLGEHDFLASASAISFVLTFIVPILLHYRRKRLLRVTPQD